MDGAITSIRAQFAEIDQAMRQIENRLRADNEQVNQIENLVAGFQAQLANMEDISIENERKPLQVNDNWDGTSRTVGEIQNGSSFAIPSRTPNVPSARIGDVLTQC